MNEDGSPVLDERGEIVLTEQGRAKAEAIRRLPEPSFALYEQANGSRLLCESCGIQADVIIDSAILDGFAEQPPLTLCRACYVYSATQMAAKVTDLPAELRKFGTAVLDATKQSERWREGRSPAGSPPMEQAS